jgi:hypothetical protein
VREEELAKQIEDARALKTELKPASEDEKLAAQAGWAEAFGDAGLALELWNKLKETAPVDGERRPWLLLATRKAHDIGPDAKRGAEERKFRSELVRKQLARAVDQQASDPAQAFAICKEILYLYEKNTDPELADILLGTRKVYENTKAKVPAGRP